MDATQLFQAALALPAPWIVERVSFDPAGEEGRGRIDLRLSFERGSRFACPDCGTPCPVHDTSEREFRHLDFFQHRAYLVAPVPRTSCRQHGVLTVSVPWARDGMGFTLFFEAYTMLMAREMPMKALARTVGENDTRLWRVVHAHVREARERVDMSGVQEVLVDETSQAKGHQYVSIFMEPARNEQPPRVLFVADGRKAEVFEEFAQDLEQHRGAAGNVRDVCMDMSSSYQKGAARSLPSARVTFDPFHVLKLVGDAVDEVRRKEQTTQPALRGSRYVWLKNPENLTGSQFETFSTLYQLNLKTVEAHHMRLNIREAWKQGTAKAARAVLLEWCRWVRRRATPKKGAPTGLEPMLRAAATIRANLVGILNYYRRHLTQGLIEGLNSTLQAARARARGYRNPVTFKAMIYLIGGRLEFNLPALTH